MVGYGGRPQARQGALLRLRQFRVLRLAAYHARLFVPDSGYAGISHFALFRRHLAHCDGARCGGVHHSRVRTMILSPPNHLPGANSRHVSRGRSGSFRVAAAAQAERYSNPAFRRKPRFLAQNGLSGPAEGRFSPPGCRLGVPRRCLAAPGRRFSTPKRRLGVTGRCLGVAGWRLGVAGRRDLVVASGGGERDNGGQSVKPRRGHAVLRRSRGDLR